MQLLIFLVGTFAWTWTIWIGTAALAAPGNSGVFSVGGPVFLLGVFGPAIVAIASTAHERGPDGVISLLARIARWQVGVRWYLFAVGYVAAVKLAAAVIGRLMFGGWARFGTESWFAIAVVVLLGWWGQAGEEIGWRGYALPRLASRLGLGGASLILGVIWAAWHLPLFFLPGTDSTGRPFAVYLLYVTSLSVAIAWLYWKTGASLLLVMMMHDAANNTIGIVASPLPESGVFAISAPPILWITLAIFWVVALVLLYDMRDATLARVDEPQLAQATP